MDLKPFFLHTTFNEENDREMVLMLWNQYVPPNFYQVVKRLEIFEYLLSQNVSFRGVNDIVKKFALEPQNWHDLKNCFTAYYSTYQYIYSMLFPKYYNQNNKYGLKNKIKFALCYDRWMANKKQEQLGKNPFNFKVPDNFEIIQRNDYEQTPIKIDNMMLLGLMFQTLGKLCRLQLKK